LWITLLIREGLIQESLKREQKWKFGHGNESYESYEGYGEVVWSHCICPLSVVITIQPGMRFLRAQAKAPEPNAGLCRSSVAFVLNMRHQSWQLMAV
jgi:hypothetical protein